MGVTMSPYDDEIDLFDLFKRLWRWKKMIVGVTPACTILVFGIYSFSLLQYSMRTRQEAPFWV